MFKEILLPNSRHLGLSRPLNKDTKQAFQTYPEEIRQKLLILRKWIFEVASEHPEIGEITETLKWGEPSYLPKQKNTGTTIRLASTSKESSSDFGMFVHCQTSLIGDFRYQFGDLFNYDGNRAIVFSVEDELPQRETKRCIYLALTYHLQKKEPPKSVGHSL